MRHFFSLILLSFGFFSILLAQSQTDEVLLTIGKNKVTRSEFERIYTKNNQNPAFDKASLDEYMELFINFKLKVLEAETLGMDTLKSFKKELNGYSKQLEKPYFTDESIDEDLVFEAYERMKSDVRASHILINCDPQSQPSDTLKAYKKIEDIRKKAVSGEDFGRLAHEFSEDPSAQRNKGELGYFTAFSMVYPFETAAYSTPVGEISSIIRTRFGYHILKVLDKKENKGQIRVAHLMRAVPQGSDIKKQQIEEKKINIIYDSIADGADFAKMVKNHSDDRGSSNKGGELPLFGTGRMIPDFEKAAFALTEIGEVSKPVKTPYGWHIIKLLEKKPLGTFDELKPSIKSKISKDIRANKGRDMVLARLKKEYKVKVNNNTIKPFYIIVDSTIIKGKWNLENAKSYNDVMITIADTFDITQQDFANYLGDNKKRRKAQPIKELIDKEFTNFVDAKVIDFERNRLEEKYPEYRFLLKEYHDGILLFNLTDEKVWSKAVKDTSGLKEFYEKNKNNYMWNERTEATLYTFNNKSYAKKISKLAKNTAKKNLNITEQQNLFVSKAAKTNSEFKLQITKGKYSKGDNSFVDAVTKKIGLKQLQEADGEYVLVYINGQVQPQTKKLNEAKGLITADYQNYLEKEWIKDLRKKYTYKIDQKVFNSMVK